MFRIVLFAATLIVASPAFTQNFSCSFGTRAACLDYGDKVCSSMGKCVSSDAICFDSYTCGFKGFVCKAKLDEVADEYDKLVGKYNKLVDNANDVQRCVSNADTLEDAQFCLYRLR